VRYWITINEPIIYVRLHYLIGTGPPGVKDVKRAIVVAQQMIRAHAAAYHALHEVQSDARVSIAHHVPALAPHNAWSPFDRWITRLTDRAFNTGFLEAFRSGIWRVPMVANWAFPEAANTLDYLGLNYYSRQFIRFLPKPGLWPGDVCDLQHHEGRQVQERTAFGWDVYPEGLEQILRDWGGQLPVLVTENGAWMREDTRRWSFIERHIQAMARAMQDGAHVLGYCYWSLLDNFEWADGFAPRFGLVEVDYATQERRPRESARRYAALCRANRLIADERRL
jgi:beta-glucosidase